MVNIVLHIAVHPVVLLLTEPRLERLHHAEDERLVHGDLLQHLGHLVVPTAHQTDAVYLLNVVPHLPPARSTRSQQDTAVTTNTVTSRGHNEHDGHGTATAQHGTVRNGAVRSQPGSLAV